VYGGAPSRHHPDYRKAVQASHLRKDNKARGVRRLMKCRGHVHDGTVHGADHLCQDAKMLSAVGPVVGSTATPSSTSSSLPEGVPALGRQQRSICTTAKNDAGF
jgi:hypothetical protein